MDKQQQAPVLHPIMVGTKVHPIWQRWFQKLKTRDDEIRRRPYKTFTTDTTLTTWDLGKSIMFSIGNANVTAILPETDINDLWAWITIVRQGTGELRIKSALESVKIERNGSVLGCREPNRVAANVTLQLVTTTQWAIIGATGIWDVMPY